MPTVLEAIDAAIAEVTTARALVSKVNAKQVRGADTVATLKSTAHAWFNNHRPVVASGAPNVDLGTTDARYTIVLNSTDRHAAKKTYLDTLRGAKDALVAARASALVPSVSLAASTDDLAPDFSALAGNQQMRDILTRRWHECHKCVRAEAHLAGVVMMGGLLEALFVARANKLPEKKPLITAASAPTNTATGKTLNYQEWMLDSYIKVAHELGWITDSAKNVADILKEYRNYVHPEKELRHGVILTFNDSSMFWQVTKALARQLLLSASKP